MNARRRVLVVDDSLSVGRFLAQALASEPSLHVVGHALDAYQARDMIKRLKPDVITLDVEMPGMDGVTFLKNLMRLHPLPVVMLSSLTEQGASVTLDALEAGAVDYLLKRATTSDADRADYIADIVSRVVRAADIEVAPVGIDAANDADPVVDPQSLALARQRLVGAGAVGGGVDKLICIGASTGGPEAIRQLMRTLEAERCAVAIAQHMSPSFMAAFADRLGRLSRFAVRVAEHDEPIRPGCGYVAPGDRHLSIVRRAGGAVCQLESGPKLHGHRPAVDRLFLSAAESLGDSALGVLLTGMGADGAFGLAALHDAGALTVVQDKPSSAVWGMPGRAAELGAADLQLPVRDVGPLFSELLATRA